MKITIEPLKQGDLKPFPTDLGFGRYFSNRMFTQHYTPDQGGTMPGSAPTAR